MSNGKAPEWVRKIQKQKENFWSKIYPAYTENEKLHFWADEILNTMRVQGETTGDAYSAFTPEWLARMQRYEHSLSRFLDRIFATFRNEINSDRFFDHVQGAAPAPSISARPKLYSQQNKGATLLVHEPETGYGKAAKTTRPKKKKR